MNDQPTKGELVVHCEHIPQVKDVYTFQSPRKLRFKRPDGTQGETQWILCCQGCYVKAEGDLNRLELPGETIWDEKIQYYQDN